MRKSGPIPQRNQVYNIVEEIEMEPSFDGIHVSGRSADCDERSLFLLDTPAKAGIKTRKRMATMPSTSKSAGDANARASEQNGFEQCVRSRVHLEKPQTHWHHHHHDHGSSDKKSHRKGKAKSDRIYKCMSHDVAARETMVDALPIRNGERMSPEGPVRLELESGLKFDLLRILQGFAVRGRIVLTEDLMMFAACRLLETRANLRREEVSSSEEDSSGSHFPEVVPAGVQDQAIMELLRVRGEDGVEEEALLETPRREPVLLLQGLPTFGAGK